MVDSLTCDELRHFNNCIECTSFLKIKHNVLYYDINLLVNTVLYFDLLPIFGMTDNFSKENQNWKRNYGVTILLSVTTEASRMLAAYNFLRRRVA